MFWIRIYALFWLCFCAYGTRHILKRGSEHDDEDEPGGEDIVHTLDNLRASLSTNVIMGFFYVLFIILVAIDASGFLLAYTYPPPRTWKPAFLLVAAAVSILDHMAGARFISKGIHNDVV